MKTLLTLFVLFFSLSVFAGGDNLGGKKIFCSEKRANGIVLLAFKFRNSSEVTIYKETTNLPLDIDIHQYNTSALEILIEHYYQNQKLYTISRKDLSVKSTQWTSLLWSFQEGTCKIIEEDIVDLFNQHLEEYKKDNKI